MSGSNEFVHRRLSSGVELGALPIAGRRTVSMEFRLLAGMANEPDDRLGIAHLVDETLDKGTERRTGRQLTDAFDAIGAQHSSHVGREVMVFRCHCLPEYATQALELFVEMLRTPTFPDEACSVAIDLAQQELTALDDEPDELARKLISRRAYGPVLGRHVLGEREALGRIGRDDIVDYWRTQFSARRLMVCVGGGVDVEPFAEAVDRAFTGFGENGSDGRSAHAVDFTPGTSHFDKELEQEYITLCWPGVAMSHADQPIEEIALAVLGGGMSARLFTEVREKQGLVYWVGAWSEHPRGAGMIFLGASTMPDRCDRTYRTLLREVDRLAEDVTDEELDRAKVGITAKQQTHGDGTAARTSGLVADLFHFGRPRTDQEKTDLVMKVTVDDVRRYLNEHPRDRLCVVTLGPKPLSNGESPNAKD